MEAYGKHQGRAKGRWKSVVGRWGVRNISASQCWWTIRTARLLMDLSTGISLLCRPSLKGPFWKRQDSTEQDKISYFCLCYQVLNNTFSMPLKRQSEMKELWNVCGRKDTFMAAQPKKFSDYWKKWGTMLSYSGGAWALKKQIWLKTNTTMKKVYSGERRPKALKNWGNRGTNTGETEALLFCTGECFRSLFSKFSTQSQSNGPTGQVWGVSPFHPAFPFVLQETTPLT